MKDLLTGKNTMRFFREKSKIISTFDYSFG